MIFRASSTANKALVVAAIIAVSCVMLASAQESEPVQSWAGMAGMPLVGDMLAGRGLDQPAILVVALHPEGPAFRDGIQTSDVLLAADGATITDPYGWLADIKTRPPGTVVELEIRRDDETLRLDLTLGTIPEDVDAGS